jgi:membrane fusion protein (multidrug efflux system)
MKILAPFDGVVGIRGVSLGDYVKDGTDLVNVEDIRNLKVDFRLPERSLSQIRPGQSVEVVADALPGVPWQGQIEAVNPRIDANGRSVELRARLDNASGKLRPGMFVRVRVIVGERNGLLVPEEAIVPQGEEFFVYTVVDGAARRVPVKIGIRRSAQVEIVQGVAAGDQVVTAGMRLFRDGQPVRVLPPANGKGSGDGGDKAGAVPGRDGAGKV